MYSFHIIISKNTNLIILLYTSTRGYTIYFGTVKVTIAKRYTYKKNYMAYISHIALFPIYSFLFYLGYISQQRLYCTCRLLF